MISVAVILNIAIIILLLIACIGSFFYVERLFIGGATAEGYLRQHLIESASGKLAVRYWLSTEVQAGKGPPVQYRRVRADSSGPLVHLWPMGNKVDLVIIEFRFPKPTELGIYILVVPYWTSLSISALLLIFLLRAKHRKKNKIGFDIRSSAYEAR